ncbi:hypothetical protein BAUCODRAFT_153833 [Baudoinia panamericana UAMH 10762]|uniref:Uncharacterized protein n=1 Tax=Baudoinia panamericana (strain UAMH 10762) TaxID=717646 RepID=M2N6I4_BAUPA|nr:uncharacterized protein BAUCODRAFT_153833 [Baudoinia panamericana UAMH 10762]EMC99688.1 hypothetical protein BAUCODRAFT_153833 [Baudoinia panamericana UAMH 10762]
MAEWSARQEMETAASTPSSQHDAAEESTGPKLAKDKHCPFCGQAFTSSSLGRHLDLYIKPRNPKPPDGVHDVEEIKKIRGGITRRQPKAISKPSSEVHVGEWRRHSSNSDAATPAPTRKPPVKVQTRVTAVSPVNSPINIKDGETMQTSLNAPNWQATGVINNLPPRAPSRNDTVPPSGQAERMQAMRRDDTGKRVERPSFDEDAILKLQEDAEVGRTAELALRELLASLEAARQKADTKELFEGVDLFSLSFPGLCLAILPAPTTLQSSTPFPGLESWPLDPPGQMQFDCLTRRMNARLRELRQTENPDESFPPATYFKQSAHVQNAYEHWQSLSESERVSAWRIESLRAFARAQEQKEQALLRLEAAETRIRHLEADFDRMSRYQLPREYLLHPPQTISAPVAVLRDVDSTHRHSFAAEASYNADALLSKWRSTVKATLRRAAAPSMRVDDPKAAQNRPVKDQIAGDMILNGAVIGVNGAMRRHAGAPVHDPGFVDYETPPEPGTVISAEEEGDEADAEGEADEDDRDSKRRVNGGALVPHKGAATAFGRPTRKEGTTNVNGKRLLMSTTGLNSRPTKVSRTR